MRVALVCPYSWSRPGGVRSHVSGLASYLRGRGADVDILAPLDDAGASYDVIPLGRTIPIRDNGSKVRVALNPFVFHRVGTVLGSTDYDLVHIHEPMIPAASLAALVLSNAPLVGTFHMYASEPGWYGRFGGLCRRALARLDARIAVSEAARGHVARTCPGDYSVIPNAIAVEPLSSRHVSRTGKRIVFLGRPEPRKGLTVLLEAFTRLPNDTTLELVGVTQPELRKVAGGLDDPVTSRIEAYGRVREEERNGLLARADVLAVPSLGAESFGIVLLEGMAAGVPVVASDVPGYRELLPHSAGRLVAPGDADALAETLARLLADDSLRQRLGAAGRDEAWRYDWSVVGSEVLDVYSSATRRHRARGARRRLTLETADASR